MFKNYVTWVQNITIMPKTEEKDAANVLQRAQEYVNGIKLINEAIVDNITDKNKKILKKLTKKV